MQTSKDYKEVLKREGLKNTKHRNSILKMIEDSDQPLCAETIFIKLKENGISISLSTVYRVLDSLVDKDIILKSSVGDEGKALFEINDLAHKHHLLCIKCRKMLSVDGCPLEDYEKELEEKLGFNITGHKLEIFGYCQGCKVSADRNK